MEINKRIELARQLKKSGSICIKKDVITSKGDLVYVKTDAPLLHPLYGCYLDNPMTWDTFTHLYLLNK